MMSFKPTRTGGRVVVVDGLYGKARVEWDADGKLVSQSLEMRDPRHPTPEQQAIIDARRPICEACPEAQRITERGVECRDCGCGLVSFIHGRCKLGKWPNQP